MSEEFKTASEKRTNYIVLMIISLIFIVLSILTDQHENFIITIPALILTTYGLFRKDKLSLPPLFIAFFTIVLISLQLTKMFLARYWILDFIADVLLGMFTCILGLMILLSLMKSLPNFDTEKPHIVTLCAFCIGIALALLLFVTDFFVEVLSPNYSEENAFELVQGIVLSAIGSGFIALLFYLNRHNGLFENTIDKYLSNNADTLGLQNIARTQALRMIEEGESSKLEFKSTLRTNLKTGEKDPRMEKAVLKTLVAFLNTRGGTLFIGVADDGTILGVDLNSFDGSKDKFGLHLNNLITKQIGGEFLPFINYGFVDIDDKPIMRIDCKISDRPVFLDDGKEQLFFVRSGPSSIDLHGIELLYYANHNFGKILKKNNHEVFR